ncbi:uncharacterized protein srcap [Aplochiton taeniatus]
MSMEELLEKYKGAYASDFEEPSASASRASSEESEVSGDEEEETEEDESDVESNSSSSDSPEESEDEDESEKDEETEDEEFDEGMEILLKEGDHSPPISSGPRPKKEISHIAATAESLQPKGYTLATTKVKTPIPFLLVGNLREYQHIGLDWLVTMYEKKLNGILADEMGLGKTIQTIALLAHLACEKGNWGPHLIIVPTSVMLNWEMELKRWCPGFKILTYYGSQKERKLKRQGWTKPNAFHVCITSYKLVLQDHQAFRRKSWRYLILDEAQNIKNFKSQRWQSLLNFNSHRRLLLTGTPLQNSLMELWSLMHFLMPHVFQSHREFKEWFSNPLTGMIEGSQEYNEGLIKRLHKVLRPFLLRRIKVDVEKQMPKKYEHVVRCRLSKRQRFLYDDFMAQASTRETLASGHFMSVINILMQLRKVCNHPNLFDPRPIHSPFITKPIVFHTASLVQEALEVSPFKRCDLSMFDLLGLEGRMSRHQADVFLPGRKVSRQLIQEVMDSPEPAPRPRPVRMKVNRMFQPLPKTDNRTVLLMNNPRPTCPVTPAAQTPRTPLITEVTPTPNPAPAVQQVVCSMVTTPPPRPPMNPNTPTAVRSSAPKPVLTVRPPTAPCTPAMPAHPTPTPPPTNIMPQRVLLSPDMQARLPSGEVVSIAQLASLAGRPVSSCQGSKPVTFQLQGNKLTLSGAQIHHQVPATPQRQVQGNVMHLVSSGGQHHLISQPAQVAVFSMASTHSANTSTAPSGIQLPHNASQVTSSAMVTSPGIVKIVVRQSAGKDGGNVPTLAVPPSPRVVPQAALHHPVTPHVRTPVSQQHPQRTPGPATATAHYTVAPPRIPTSTPSHPQPPHPAVLKVVQPPAANAEQSATARVNSSSSTSASAPREGKSSRTNASGKPGSHGSGALPQRPRARPRPPPPSPFFIPSLAETHKKQRESLLDHIFQVNERRCSAKPVYGLEVLDFLSFLPGSKPSPAPVALGEWGRSGHTSCLLAQSHTDHWAQSHTLRDAIHTHEEKLEQINNIIERFTFVIPPVEAPPISMHCCHPPPSLSHKQAVFSSMLSSAIPPLSHRLHRIQCNMRTHFPDLRLIQYDCGKLQMLHTLLRELKTGGHRVLIFTQMTRMLDVLEQFLNYHGHIYLRLDGSTRIEQRQSLMERFNADRRIFCFILSTRSGGVGVNLTGADTVVFYDSDWNPTMDAQAQDRCHRIGQTRDVHIYRLISERTVEENILKKANQKRMLGDMAIEGGNFTTAFFKEQTIRDLFDVSEGERKEVTVEVSVPQVEEEEAVNKQSTTILEQALCRAEDEEDIVAASQAKAEQVAELAEFNENIPLDDGGDRDPEEEELSKAEQEIAALVEQLTPIERYAMNFLEASLEDVCKEELKQAEEQVEAARKGLDQAKEEGLKLNVSSSDNSDDDEDLPPPPSKEPAQPTPGRRGRKPKDKSAASTRTSGRLRGTAASPEAERPVAREVPERPPLGLRGRGATASKDGTAAPDPSRTQASSARLQDASKPFSSPSREPTPKSPRSLLANRSLSHSSSVPSAATTSPPGGKSQTVGEPDSSRSARKERGAQVSSPESGSCPVDHQLYSAQARNYDGRDQSSMSPPSGSSLTRSPRKRQSADGEVLRGLAEDCPSAKVLRKLPGRLVTVVGDKEPRKRRRRRRRRRCSSGTGGGGEGSSEETDHATGSDDPSRDSSTPQSPDRKSKGTLSKSPQDQDSPTAAVQSNPVRGCPPYSPPRTFADMPVLRNLPVRRRLETESRMAAQLGEQQQHLGRGRGGNYPRKTDTQPGVKGSTPSTTTTTSTTPDAGVDTPVPVKRKRGRPPKTPPKVAVIEHVSPPPPPKIPTILESPPFSPKRKRGRPRKDSTPVPDKMGVGKNSSPPANANASGQAAVAFVQPGFQAALAKPQSQTLTAAATHSPSPHYNPSPMPDSSPHYNPSPMPDSSPHSEEQHPSPSCSEQTTNLGTVFLTCLHINLALNSSSSPDQIAGRSLHISGHQTFSSSSSADPCSPNSDSSYSSCCPCASCPINDAYSAVYIIYRLTEPYSSTLHSLYAYCYYCPYSSPENLSHLRQWLRRHIHHCRLKARCYTYRCCGCHPGAVCRHGDVCDLLCPFPHSTPLLSLSKYPLLPSRSKYPALLRCLSKYPTLLPLLSKYPTLPLPLSRSKYPALLPSWSKYPALLPSRSKYPALLPSRSTYPALLPSRSKYPALLSSRSKYPALLSSRSKYPALLSSRSKYPALLPSRSKYPTLLPSLPKYPTLPLSRSKYPALLPSLPKYPTLPLSRSKYPTLPLSRSKYPALLPSLSKYPTLPLSRSKYPTLPLSRSKYPTLPLSRSNVVPTVDVPKSQSVELELKEPKQNRDQACDMELDSAEAKTESKVEKNAQASAALPKQEAEKQEPDWSEVVRDERVPGQKWPLSRQSSQESIRSSSASSACSTSTPTRSAHHKKTYERRAVKRKKDEHHAGSEKVEGNGEQGPPDPAAGAASSQRRRSSRRSTSSSDSDSSGDGKERCLTRSAGSGRAEGEKDGESKQQQQQQRRRPARSGERNAAHNNLPSAASAGESGSETSVRVTRKSQPTPDSSKPQTISVPSTPPQPEVLGKRCSALNAAAKLLAMRGRVDTPGHSSRKDSGAKAALSQQNTPPASSEKEKSQKLPCSPQTNSVPLSNNKIGGGKPKTPSSASRSTRLRPGALVPPLKATLEYKRGKPEEKDGKEKKRPGGADGKETEGESRSSRGHSACSSMSSDGGGNRGRGVSRSRSSSNSSQRTHSLSSQSTGPRQSRSRAASSGSERGRSSERVTRRSRGKDGQCRGRDRRKERRSQHQETLTQDVDAGAGSEEGTPDRMLRSVAALVAAQARTPASNTRSSSGQQRHNKT